MRKSAAANKAQGAEVGGAPAVCVRNTACCVSRTRASESFGSCGGGVAEGSTEGGSVGAALVSWIPLGSGSAVQVALGVMVAVTVGVGVTVGEGVRVAVAGMREVALGVMVAVGLGLAVTVGVRLAVGVGGSGV